jgi:hypothetical protein
MRLSLAPAKKNNGVDGRSSANAYRTVPFPAKQQKRYNAAITAVAAFLLGRSRGRGIGRIIVSNVVGKRLWRRLEVLPWKLSRTMTLSFC